MFEPTTILIITSGYLLLLFVIAETGEKFVNAISPRLKSLVVALAMGTYCTAWTFYGTVSQAVHNGWYLPPTFIGSCVTLLLGFALLVKMFERSKQYNTTSIADFISAQYGKSDIVAGLITVVSCIALLPYIALQLKAVSMSLQMLTTGDWQDTPVNSSPFWNDTTFAVAILMALFTIIYGTREINPAEKHTGLLVAMGFESIIKLLAFTLVGIYVGYVLFDGVEDVMLNIAENPALLDMLSEREVHGGYFASIILGMAAIVCLPRHFHILAVESSSINDLRAIRWLIPTYLLIISLLVFVIAYGGLAYFNNAEINPESYFIAIPLATDNGLLTLFAFIGGLAAATSMVILATIALSTMISNNLVIPILLRLESHSADHHSDLTSLVKSIRRGAIVAFLLLAYAYYRYLGNQTDLPTIGLLAMALVLQFSPSILAALFNFRSHPNAVILSVAGGTMTWLYTLLVPALSSSSILFTQLVETGPFDIEWLQPQRLFGISLFSSLGNGVFWSLFVNTLIFLTVSFAYRSERKSPLSPAHLYPKLSVSELKNVAARFMGSKQAELALNEYRENNAIDVDVNDTASEQLIDFFEMMLAGIIGTPSAKHVIAKAGTDILNHGSPASEMLDEASQVFQFSRDLLQSSMDQISQGISVIDANHRLVSWNRRYLEIFEYPEGMIYVGRHVGDLIKYNVARGECGPGSAEEHVNKRLSHLEKGTPYVYHRTRRDNLILEIRGTPLPGGGYVTTYTDITEFMRALKEAENARELLEERVAERTSELLEAKQDADKANLSKTKFLASAGHDLIQPLNAAKLFVSTLLQHDLSDDDKSLINDLANSLYSAEALITELLEIAKIDAGIVKANVCEFHLSDIFDSLRKEFTLLAEDENIVFRCVPSRYKIVSDPALLHRILQNLLSNAIKYTNRGRVLLGCRKKGDHLSIEVWDTGIGIAKEHHEDIFVEFKRISSNDGQAGMGLGLSTVQRLCQLLQHEISINSKENKGSVFSISVPIGKTNNQNNKAENVQSFEKPFSPKLDLDILLVDDDQHIRESLRRLLETWGARVHSCDGPEKMMKFVNEGASPDILIVDYHLNENTNGVDLTGRYLEETGHSPPCIIISADHSDTLRLKIQEAGFIQIEKPIKPLKLRNVLSRYANMNHS